MGSHIELNVQRLRGWAERNGWVHVAEDPEVWGIVRADGSASWRVKIKRQPSTRNGLLPGSGVARLDARLSPGQYLTPFTGALGGRAIGAHIPLDEPWGEVVL